MSHKDNRIYRMPILFLSMTMLLGCQLPADQNQFSVGKNGNIDNIRIATTAESITRFAATELQRYLQQITGTRLEIIDDSHDNNGGKHSIRLLLTEDTAFRWDGYRISTSKAGLELSGREPRALLYAVYDLLEQSGCSFIYPGEKEQIVPVKENIKMPTLDTMVNPLLEHRGLAPYGLDAAGLEAGRDFIDWMAKNKLNYILVSEDRPSDSDGPAHGSVWKEVQHELLPELQKRGFVIEMSEHCTPVFFPRSLFQTHPEWFALNNGERKLGPPPYSGQMCYSNKEAIRYYSNALAKYAAEHPEFHAIGTWPLDGGDYCECQPCKDPQTVFNAVMEIAQKIKQVRPDIIVEHLAYKEQTWQPPAMQNIPDNISVLWCRNAGQSEDLVKEWVKKSSTGAGVYQFEYFLGDNYRSRANVWLRPQYATSIVSHAREIGYRGVISLTLPIQNWWRSSFNNRFFARSCWEADMDIEKELKKYYSDYYGQQAEQAEKIFKMIFEELQQEPFLPEPENIAAGWPRVRTAGPQILQQLDQVMQQGRDSVIRKRFGRIKAYVQFMVLHVQAYGSRKKEDLTRLMEFSKENTDQSMVLMYPGYIWWRNEEDF